MENYCERLNWHQFPCKLEAQPGQFKGRLTFLFDFSWHQTEYDYLKHRSLLLLEMLSYDCYVIIIIIISNSWHYSCPRSVYCRSIVFLLVVKLFEIYRFIMKIFTHIPYNRWDKYRKLKVPCLVSARFKTDLIKTVSRIVYSKP